MHVRYDPRMRQVLVHLRQHAGRDVMRSILVGLGLVSLLALAVTFAEAQQDEKKGRKGRGPGFGGGIPSTPGRVLSSFQQERLKLTDEQKRQVDDLQTDVDARLKKILTEDQQKTLRERPTGLRPPGAPGRGPGRPPEGAPKGPPRGPRDGKEQAEGSPSFTINVYVTPDGPVVRTEPGQRPGGPPRGGPRPPFGPGKGRP
jgi:hypothetical protein